MLTNNMKIFNFMYNGSLLIVALLAFKFHVPWIMSETRQAVVIIKGSSYHCPSAHQFMEIGSLL